MMNSQLAVPLPVRHSRRRLRHRRHRHIPRRLLIHHSLRPDVHGPEDVLQLPGNHRDAVRSDIKRTRQPQDAHNETPAGVHADLRREPPSGFGNHSSLPPGHHHRCQPHRRRRRHNHRHGQLDRNGVVQRICQVVHGDVCCREPVLHGRDDHADGRQHARNDDGGPSGGSLRRTLDENRCRKHESIHIRRSDVRDSHGHVADDA
ncbi:hypothetical protein M427DRAFT_455560 [Gonapodya prolifera JEL478]|uniref:Uncharacterized protein n=1 Tax=Gonapodya prolifera (strain JEL478) TaxID=1344416 RepID=A0A139A2T4_GONPJ|nr:hypothetical protein M427DRAFT_455560 [Gonapodya prolifera JEL478]|eukprot:KXS11009.1 hypothetical protein M427DRAFT_455560 [Gonapodya prolifera JEL478]